jgi:hypothetical protein
MISRLSLTYGHAIYASMKSLLSIAVAAFVCAPVAFAADKACCDEAKTASEKAKASDCCAEKKSCPKDAALRVTLLTHKGALVAKR